MIFSNVFFGCKDKTESNITIQKGDFNGLYNIEYKDTDIQHVWIFTEDLHYILYPAYLGESKFLNYETPTHYYVDGNKFYSCSIDNQMNATPIEECRGKNNDPRFKIISIDTIETSYSKEKHQVIVLQDYYSKDPIKLKKRL